MVELHALVRLKLVALCVYSVAIFGAARRGVRRAPERRVDDVRRVVEERLVVVIALAPTVRELGHDCVERARGQHAEGQEEVGGILHRDEGTGAAKNKKSQQQAPVRAV